MRLSSTRLAAILCGLGLQGCGSGPLERADARKLADEKPLTRAVFLRVECKQPEKTGSAEDWLRDLSRGLRELRACAMVWTEGEDFDGDADLEVIVKVLPFEPNPSEIAAAAACLDVLAWSTVPLLPWWIPDVDVYPAVRLEVRGMLRTTGNPGPPDINKEVFVPEVRTCLLDRYPFLSWQTLGSVIIPPFIFKSGDPDRVMDVAGEQIRLEAAVQVASLIKHSAQADELITELAPQGRRNLRFLSSPDLGRLTLRIAGQPGVPTPIPIDPHESGERTVSLERIPGFNGDGEKLIRIEAYSRKPRGAVLPYSILFKPGEGSRPVAPPGGP